MKGILPQCDADEILRLCPVVQAVKPSLLNSSSSRSKRTSTSSQDEFSDAELQWALRESKQLDEDDDQTLKQALEMSMLGRSDVGSATMTISLVSLI